MSTNGKTKTWPDSTVILARALVEAAEKTGKPVQDDRVYAAARQPLSDAKQSFSDAKSA